MLGGKGGRRRSPAAGRRRRRLQALKRPGRAPPPNAARPPPPNPTPPPPARRDAPDAVRGFLRAAARGYAHAAAQPADAADALIQYTDQQVASGAWPPLAAPLERGMLEESAAALAPHLLRADGSWGRMDMDK